MNIHGLLTPAGHRGQNSLIGAETTGRRSKSISAVHPLSVDWKLMKCNIKRLGGNGQDPACQSLCWCGWVSRFGDMVIGQCFIIHTVETGQCFIIHILTVYSETLNNASYSETWTVLHHTYSRNWTVIHHILIKGDLDNASLYIHLYNQTWTVLNHTYIMYSGTWTVADHTYNRNHLETCVKVSWHS